MTNPTSKEQIRFVRKHKKEKKWILCSQLFLFVLFLLLWEICVSKDYLNGFIFSSPSRVFQCFFDLLKDGSIFHHIGVTFLETIASFGIITILTLLFASILWWFPMIEKILEPYLVVFNSLPKSALAPILIVWLGNNMKTIIVTAILIAVFGSILNLYSGFSQVDKNRRMLIRTLGGNKQQEFTLAVLPSCIPLFLSIMKVNIGLSLVGVIIGEFLAAKAGLGYLILYSSQVFKMDWVLLSIILLCMMAMGLYAILSFIEKRYDKRSR